MHYYRNEALLDFPTIHESLHESPTRVNKIIHDSPTRVNKLKYADISGTNNYTNYSVQQRTKEVSVNSTVNVYVNGKVTKVNIQHTKPIDIPKVSYRDIVKKTKQRLNRLDVSPPTYPKYIITTDEYFDYIRARNHNLRSMMVIRKNPVEEKSFYGTVTFGQLLEQSFKKLTADYQNFRANYYISLDRKHNKREFNFFNVTYNVHMVPKNVSI